jgi:hypothetical protein
MRLDPRDGWLPDGSGHCLGCGERTTGAAVMARRGKERRVPVCPECASLSRESADVRDLIRARAGGEIPT